MINMSAKHSRVFLSPPHMGEKELEFVHQAFASNYIAPLGPMVDAFEREFADYTGIRHCVAVSSGTAAMHLALRCLDIGPGDEVFASTLTFIGSITPILFQWGTPVFVDSDMETWNMDPDLLEEELHSCERRGRLPKAVVPTDLYGQCANYDRIFKICEAYGVPVVVDAAEALGAMYQKTVTRGQRTEDRGQTDPGDQKLEDSSNWLHAGKGARAAIFSFNGNKIITTSGGGMLASDDPDLIAHARFLSQQARDPAPHYEHSSIGYNYRMSNVLAAIGRGQIRALHERLQRKRQIFTYYRQALGDIPGIQFMPEAPYGRSNCWLTVILINPEQFGGTREEVRRALEAENIESRPIWKPMHLQPVFDTETQSDESKKGSAVAKQNGTDRPKRYRARCIRGKVSERLFELGLCLPSGTQITDEEQQRVVRIVRQAGKQER